MILQSLKRVITYNENKLKKMNTLDSPPIATVEILQEQLEKQNKHLHLLNTNIDKIRQNVQFFAWIAIITIILTVLVGFGVVYVN